MELTVTNQAGAAEQENVEVSAKVFGRAFNEPLVHQVVVACLASHRQGSRAQKNRSAVSGGGRKPWRQKGTGRARAGTIRSPLWRGGGRTFPAANQDFSQKINKKMYRGALCAILSEMIRQQRMVVVGELFLPTAKTKDLVTWLGVMALDDVLVVTDQPNENLELAIRNLTHSSTQTATSLSPINLLRHDKMLITVAALKLLERRSE